MEGALCWHGRKGKDPSLRRGQDRQHIQEDLGRLSVADKEGKAVRVQLQRAQEREDWHSEGVH